MVLLLVWYNDTKQVIVGTGASYTIGGDPVAIGSETAQIININREDNVIRIRRSTGVSTSGIGLTQSQTQGLIGLGISYYSNRLDIPLTIEPFESNVNRKFYFNVQESVGFGTTVSQTITRNYQYLGVTADRSILTQSIFLENHGFKTNDTLEFSIPSGGTSFSWTNVPSAGGASLSNAISFGNCLHWWWRWKRGYTYTEAAGTPGLRAFFDEPDFSGHKLKLKGRRPVEGATYPRTPNSIGRSTTTYPELIV